VRRYPGRGGMTSLMGFPSVSEERDTASPQITFAELRFLMPKGKLNGTVRSFR
jgi:hypothetical protein